jgi:hypothetical protein
MHRLPDAMNTPHRLSRVLLLFTLGCAASPEVALEDGDQGGAAGADTTGAGGNINSGGGAGDPGDAGATQADSGGVGGAGDADAFLTAESEAIEIHWFNFFDGGYRFERRLDQLSPEQLGLADAIEVVPSSGDCWEDATEMSITVTGGDTAREFSANEYTGTCGRDGTLVNFEAVSDLLDTVECLPAQGYDGRSAETAPSVLPGDGCWHGLFNGSGTTPQWWFRMEIPTAGEYQISLDRCGDRALALDLFEHDATTEVASTSGQGECPVLLHAFADAGSYALRVQMLSGTYAGDFFLAFEAISAP